MAEAVKAYRELTKDKLFKELKWQKEEAWRREQGRLDYARNEGMEQGKLKIASNMLAKKADINFICEVTGLSKAQIKKLKNKSDI